MTKALMFDLGGVLIENDMFAELQKVLTKPLAENDLKAKWLKSLAVREFELGLCSPEKFAEALVVEFELRITPVAFIEAFSGWPKGFYAGAEALLGSLSQRYLTACLSNSNALHWTMAVTSHFDRFYSSHLLNKIKPDAEVFSFVTTDVGCEPHEISFFDDSPLNVEAARAFGWDAHLTDGYEALLDVLNQTGALSKK